ncbi:MAG: ribosomal RNA small subunit methyltransferase A [Bryobacterales bacterium]|nr:ribosomal RNA small subunit methyltransferase A [Bryobacterales bacterium]
MPQKLGQHFLRRPATLEKIAAAAIPEHAAQVIEIGAGEGVLTEKLLERADKVYAIEVDPELVARLMLRFRGEPKLKIVAQDVLATDLTQWGRAVVTGNLPYYITSPVIERTLAMGKLLERAVFLIQKEVAERITASPGTRDYGFLTVATQLHATSKMLFKVPPGAFSPPPRVDSAVIRLDPLPAPNWATRRPCWPSSASASSRSARRCATTWPPSSGANCSMPSPRQACGPSS